MDNLEARFMVCCEELLGASEHFGLGLDVRVLEKALKRMMLMVYDLEVKLASRDTK